MFAPAAWAKAAQRRSLLSDARTERFEGFGLLALPLSSGHVLAFHRYVTSSIGPPFTAVWHRDPTGRWSVHADVLPNRSVARYYAPALHDMQVDTIDLVWKSERDLTVYVRAARLHIALRLETTAATRTLTALTSAVPAPLWRFAVVASGVGRIAGAALNTGALTLHGNAPGGGVVRMRPRALWRVAAAAAMLDGRDLGEVIVLDQAVALGEVPLPRAAVFVAGCTEFERRQ